MATLGDVAARAGVSVSAVSRVLSDSPTARVSDATRRRIVDAARELRYRPNFAGRALKSARTHVIGLVVPDLTNALFTELMQGAEDEAAAYHHTVLLGRSDDVRPNAEVIARLLGEGRVDGMALQVGDGVAPAGLVELLASFPQIVLINSALAGHTGSVSLDDEEGARVAVQHLIDLGHDRIAFVNGRPRSYTAKRRHTGYRRALTDAGLTMPRNYETRLGYRAGDGREALSRILGREPRPTAVAVANVNAAIGVLTEARVAGLRVPDDLSVVCVHDSWTAENTWPPLTAVRMPLYALGRAAVHSVIGRVAGTTPTDRTIVDPAPALVVRESTGPPPAGG